MLIRLTKRDIQEIDSNAKLLDELISADVIYVADDGPPLKPIYVWMRPIDAAHDLEPPAEKNKVVSIVVEPEDAALLEATVKRLKQSS